MNNVQLDGYMLEILLFSYTSEQKYKKSLKVTEAWRDQ